MTKKTPPDYPGAEAILKAFGEALRDIRLAKGLSLTKLTPCSRKLCTLVSCIRDRGSAAPGKSRTTLDRIGIERSLYPFRAAAPMIDVSVRAWRVNDACKQRAFSITHCRAGCTIRANALEVIDSRKV